MAKRDQTLLDNNRTNINLLNSEIDKVLPEYFQEDFPKLKSLFEAYYEFMDSADNPSGQIKRLSSSRDATQVPESLLQYLEDELLLGQAYFGGFLNKREAIKFSNTLYRSKGTKYSIEQFFRGFFAQDPQIIYPKNDIFKVGPSIDYEQDSINTGSQQIKEPASVIGPESRKFITDDKLYQVMSVLIRIGLPLNEWIDTYKLFVHPAGVYLGAELLLELVNTVGLSIAQDEIGDPIAEAVSSEAFATMSIGAETSQTLLLQDSALGIRRFATGNEFRDIGTRTIDSSMPDRSTYDILGLSGTFMSDSGLASGSPTMDMDSEGVITIQSTMDMGKFSTLFDSDNSADSAHYPFNHV